MRSTFVIAIVLSALCGCAQVPPPTYTPPGPFGLPAEQYPNPLPVGQLDRDFVWDQVVDVVDDYFKVDREERPRLAGDILTEGRLDTYPQTGSTLFEPWRGDSVTGYDRLESTLQSIRRRAMVRVIPTQQGYLIDVTVVKELEDVLQPEHSTAGGSLFRNDLSQTRFAEGSGERADSLSGKTKPIGSQPKNIPPPTAWLPKGRDANLEQVILAKINLRLSATVGGYGPPIQAGIPGQVVPLPPVYNPPY